MSVPMTDITAAIRSFFDAQGWKYQFSPEKNLFTLQFTLQSRLSAVSVRILTASLKDDPSQCGAVLSYTTPGPKADASCMAQVGEYLHRINHSISLGRFDLDPRGGEIRFMQYVSCERMPGEAELDSLVAAPISSFEHFGDGLLAVSMGLQTPKEAHNAARGK